jgi:protein-disulfide isomerase
MAERRKQRRRRQMLLTAVIATGVILLLAAIVILPGALTAWSAARVPVGEFVTPAPWTRPAGEGTALGDPNAPVLIEVYADFQCPACRIYSEEVEQKVVTDFVATGKAYYVFRQWPFVDTNSMLKESQQSANASMCAAEQGHFWEYHDMLFANQTGENVGDFTDKRLTAFAEALKLDMGQFNTCFKANEYKEQITADFQGGKQRGITGTPSVLVNGVEVMPGYIPTYEKLVEAINTALGQ